MKNGGALSSYKYLFAIHEFKIIKFQGLSSNPMNFEKTSHQEITFE